MVDFTRAARPVASAALGIALFFTSPAAAQVVSNPVISRNMPAFASSNTSTARRANDTDYSTYWESTGQPAWIAYDLSAVPSAQRQQVLVAWDNNTGGYYDITIIASGVYNLPGPYVIEGNAAAGGGSSPPASGWVVLASSPNPQIYSGNQHLISNFGGNNWIRFRTTDVNPKNESGPAVALNLDVHDVHLGVQDSWMFYGDSITYYCWENAGKFATLINASNPQFFPAANNGGIPYMTASWVIPLFSRWLPLFPGKYVGISYGTNDAGGATPAEFYNSMKNLADQVLAVGKIPVIPTIPWYVPSGSSDSLVRALNAQIAKLKTDYTGRILDGPDLYAAFQNRPDLLADGLHPNAAGKVVMQQAWATKMLSVVYAASGAAPSAPTNFRVTSP